MFLHFFQRIFILICLFLYFTIGSIAGMALIYFGIVWFFSIPAVRDVVGFVLSLIVGLGWLLGSQAVSAIKTIANDDGHSGSTR